MKKYRCTICGYVYDESQEKVKFSDLPEDWVCPLCGAPKSAFEEVKEETKKEPIKKASKKNIEVDDDLRKLSDGELSAIFSNLARASEKQHLDYESKLLGELADYYKDKVVLDSKYNLNDFGKLIKEDLGNFPGIMDDARSKEDRGSLRCLTWSEKVTRILNSIIDRYGKEGIDIIKNTNVYVCDICGFIYIGDKCPEVCPVCKVPSLKIIKMEVE